MKPSLKDNLINEYFSRLNIILPDYKQSLLMTMTEWEQWFKDHPTNLTEKET